MIQLLRTSIRILFAVAGMLFGMQGAYAQSQSFGWEPEDPPDESGFTDLGAGVAVCGRTAAIGAPQYLAQTPEFDLLWEGLVNVYTTDAERTRWTLLTVLHADDDSFENREFGKAIAMYGNRLVIATNATVRIYERRLGDYQLLDRVVFSDATTSGAMQFEKDVLAVGLQNDSGGSSVRVFRINLYGKARQVASLSPGGALSLDADADTLAIGTDGRVNLYQPHGPTWVRTETVPAPSSTAVGFGSSVALHNNRLVVGAPLENQELLENSFLWSGAVHVYLRVNGHWVRVQRLASNDPAQPSYALVGFGSQVVTSGGYVWITAPYEHEQNASTVQNGPASLYRWNAGRLEFVGHFGNSLPGGGIDMTRRYVIEGDIFDGALAHFEGAHIIDLATIVPTSIASADDAVTTSPED
jgi:hypothetical protein